MIKEKFASLSQSQKKWTIIFLIILLVIFFVNVLFLPIKKYKHNGQEKYKNRIELSNKINSLTAQKQKNANLNGDQIKELLRVVAQKNQLEINSISNKNDKQIEVKFDKVNPEKFSSWLLEIENEGVNVINITISREENSIDSNIIIEVR